MWKGHKFRGSMGCMLSPVGPHKTLMLRPNRLSVMVLGGRAFGRWWGRECGALMDGITVFIKETPESPFLSSPMCRHGEKTPSMNHEAGSTRPWTCLCLDGGLPVSRTKLNCYCLCNSPVASCCSSRKELKELCTCSGPLHSLTATLINAPVLCSLYTHDRLKDKTPDSQPKTSSPLSPTQKRTLVWRHFGEWSASG